MSNDLSLKSESTKSISESYTKTTKSISESFSKSSKPTGNSNQISESLSKPSRSTISEEQHGAGGKLGQIMLDQINQNEAIDHNLRIVDQIQSNRFLDEMRHIQETGKKAAELMLKASRNIARQVSLFFHFFEDIPVSRTNFNQKS